MKPHERTISTRLKQLAGVKEATKTNLIKSDMDILDNNKLIAEFMGLPEENVFEYLWNGYHIRDKNDLDYHKSWDWLIPVVERLEAIKLGDITIPTIFDDEDPFLDASFVFEITYSNCEVHLQATMKLYENLISVTDKPTKREAVYTAVVGCVKWYNENRQQ